MKDQEIMAQKQIKLPRLIKEEENIDEEDE